MKKLYKHDKNFIHSFFSFLPNIEYSSNKSSYAGLKLQIEHSLKHIKGKTNHRHKQTAIFPFILHNYPKAEIN